jgi:hypothetical protein
MALPTQLYRSSFTIGKVIYPNLWACLEDSDQLETEVKTMRKMSKWLVLYFLLTIALLSCAKQSNTNSDELEKQFSTVVPISDMNRSIQVVVDNKNTSFKSGSEIVLIIYNKSSDFIYFDTSSFIKLMGSSDDLRWVEVKNAITYMDTILLSPEGIVLLDSQYTVVQPILDQSVLDAGNENVRGRIVVIGEIMKGETRTGQKVSAYVDVILKP